MRHILLSLILLVSAFQIACAKPTNSAHAAQLHQQSLVIDTHADTTQRFIYDNFDLAHKDKLGSIDIPRMRAGGLGGIFFSIWMPGNITGPEAVTRALAQIKAVREQVRKHPAELALCTSADAVIAAHKQGKIAVLIGVEGGHMLNNDLATLHQFANLGVRYMTLTHSLNTDWADSSTDKPLHNGLTPFGKQVVVEMNKLGMLIDISHVSDKTFYDVIAISKAPVIASHSSCRALCNAPRNMTDAMIKTLAKNGGVIQINYNLGFISQAYRDAATTSLALKTNDAHIDQLCGTNESCSINARAVATHKLMQQGKLPSVGVKKIIEHIDHVVKLVGVDHVGLGSDFDGATMPLGMEDATHLPQITTALVERGYTDQDIQKILGGNILRVMRAAQLAATKDG